MIGDRGVKSSDVNQHKRLAGATSSGNFGVEKLPQRDVPHPDVNMKHEPMDDGSRAKGIGRKGGYDMQSAPDHGVGKGVKDHFMRDGKV